MRCTATQNPLRTVAEFRSGSMLSKKSAVRADVLGRWFGVASSELIGLLASPGAGVDLDAETTN